MSGDAVITRGTHRATWSAMVTMVMVLTSLGIPCGTPFATLGAVAALNLPRREAVVLILVNWLASQVIGFAWLDYPHNAICYLNGIGLCAAALVGTWGGLMSHSWLRTAAPRAAVIGTFATVFVSYEAVLFACSPFDRAAAFAPAVILYVLGANCAAFVGLMWLQGVAQAVSCTLVGAQARRLVPTPDR